MNEVMLFAIGLVAGLLIAGFNQKSVTVNVESNVSLDPFDDEDTDLVDDDEEEGEAWKRSRN